MYMFAKRNPMLQANLWFVCVQKRARSRSIQLLRRLLLLLVCTPDDMNVITIAWTSQTEYSRTSNSMTLLHIWYRRVLLFRVSSISLSYFVQSNVIQAFELLDNLHVRHRAIDYFFQYNANYKIKLHDFMRASLVWIRHVLVAVVVVFVRF